VVVVAQRRAIESDYFFGIKILWLGRVGKIFAYLGAATIIVDLIGYDKFEHAADKTANFSRNFDAERWISKSGLTYVAARVIPGIIICALIWIAVNAWNDYFGWPVDYGDSTDDGGSHPVILMGILILCFYYAIVQFFVSNIFQGLAFIARFVSSRKYIQAAAIFVATIGVFFDLLAS
jgi:hypothetical protein